MKSEFRHDIDEQAIRTLILTEWDRERIVRFATHLMGDKCQECIYGEQEGNPSGDITLTT